MKEYIDDTCLVTCVDNDKVITAELLDFKEKRLLSVSLNRSMRLNMQWNGMIYEAKMSGMTFTSSGPKITVTKSPRS
jgi:hypothetical protein